jgi:galactonate dehydratase
MLDRRSFLTAGLAGAATALTPRLLAQATPVADTQDKGNLSALRITDVKTFLVDAGNDENFVFVKPYTNQGITGLGEGTLSAKCKTVATAIEEHKRFLVGKNPAEIERLWQTMFRGPRYRGGPVLMSALSAVEIALWDILGKALNQPIYQLLGGKARDKVRLYCHEGYLERLSHRKRRRPQSYEEEIALWPQRKAEGWTCVKGGFFPQQKGVIDFPSALREGIKMFEDVRAAVGPDFDIIAELHAKAPPTWAAEFCRLAEPLRPLWVEEATQLENEDVGELRLLRNRTRVPLATGERLTSRYHFAPLCTEQLVDVIMPDVVHVGGILEMKKIAALAECFRVDVSPHTPQSEVSNMASLHFCLCTPNATLLELGSGHDPFWSDLYQGGGIKIEKGFALPPEKPGLGLELDEAVAAKFPYQEKDYEVLRTSDGAAVDR